jgi:hypothetical protein
MIVVLLCLAQVQSQDDFELSPQPSSNKITHKLYHSYDGRSWEERGSIHLSVFGDKRRKPLISVKNTKFDKEKLKQSQFYYVGVYSDEESGFVIQSSVPACFVLGSDLQDNINVLVDSETGGITAINYKTESKTCEKSTSALKLQTMAEVIHTKEAFKPYFAMPKPVEEQDQRSFFAKYVRNM